MICSQACMLTPQLACPLIKPSNPLVMTQYLAQPSMEALVSSDSEVFCGFCNVVQCSECHPRHPRLV